MQGNTWSTYTSRFRFAEDPWWVADYCCILFFGGTSGEHPIKFQNVGNKIEKFNKLRNILYLNGLAGSREETKKYWRDHLRSCLSPTSAHFTIFPTFSQHKALTALAQKLSSQLTPCATRKRSWSNQGQDLKPRHHIPPQHQRTRWLSPRLPWRLFLRRVRSSLQLMH